MNRDHIRKHRRIKRNLEIHYSPLNWVSLFLRSKRVGKAINLSAGGILIETNDEFQVGELIKLDILLPEWEKAKKEYSEIHHRDTSKSIKIIGKAVHVRRVTPKKHRLGVEYELIDKDQQSTLDWLINLSCPSTAQHLIGKGHS